MSDFRKEHMNWVAKVNLKMDILNQNIQHAMKLGEENDRKMMDKGTQTDYSTGPTREEIEAFVMKFYDIEGTVKEYIEKYGKYIIDAMDDKDFEDVYDYSNTLKFSLSKGV